MEVTNWLDEAVQQTKDKYQVQRALEQKLLQEEALKASLASQFCRDLFEWLQTIDSKFNSRFGGQVLAVTVVGSQGNRSVQVLARPIRAQERFAELRYEEDITCLALSVGSTATNTEVIKMVPSAGGGILAKIGTEDYTPEQLGQKIINDLLDIDLMHTVSRPLSLEEPRCNVSRNDIEMRGRTPVAGGSNGGCCVGSIA